MLSALLIVNYKNQTFVPIGDTSEYSKQDCERHELDVPNGRGEVAVVRQVRCEVWLAGTETRYYIFVHPRDDENARNNMVFSYSNLDTDFDYDVAPKLTWAGDSSLKVVVGRMPQDYYGVTDAGVVSIAYEFGGEFLTHPMCWGCGSEGTTVAPIPHRIPIHALSIPPWSRLRVGMKVYLGDGMFAEATTQRVCPTVATYRASEQHKSSRCQYLKYGAPATVRAIIPSGPGDWYFPAPLVRLRALDGSWDGVAGVLTLQPNIPIGTTLVMTTGGFPLTLEACRSFFCGAGTDLGNGARVKLLRYFPGSKDAQQLYVEVLDGRSKGRKGWLFTSESQTNESMYAGEYALDFSQKPELTTDPTLMAPLRSQLRSTYL